MRDLPFVSGSSKNITTVAMDDDAPNNPNTPDIPILFFIIGYNLVKPNNKVLKRQKIYPPQRPRTFVGSSSPIMRPGRGKKPRVLNATYPRIRIGGVTPVPGPSLSRNARLRAQTAVPIPDTMTRERRVTFNSRTQAAIVTPSLTYALALAAVWN